MWTRFEQLIVVAVPSTSLWLQILAMSKGFKSPGQPNTRLPSVATRYSFVVK